MIICTEKRIIGSLWGISMGGEGGDKPSPPPPNWIISEPPHPIPTPHIQPKQQTINYKKSNYCNTPNQPFMCRLRLCRQRLCRQRLCQHNFDFVVIEAKTGFICRLNEKAIIRYYNCCCFFGKLHNFLKSGKFVNFITVKMNIAD